MKDLWKNRDFKVMLLKEVYEPFDSDDYLYEIKFDGIRCLVFVNKTSITLVSRNGVDITYLFPELSKIKELVSENVIFDGEIVSLENGVPSFSKLSKRLHLKSESSIKKESVSNPVGYVVFDIIYEGKNLVDMTLVERKTILDKYEENEVFVKSAVFDKGVSLFNEVKNRGLEGIVAKLKNGKYHVNERTDDFIKIKNVREEAFYICGYVEKPENYVFSILLCERINGKFSYVGKVNVSKKDKVYDLVHKEKSVSCPFEDKVSDAVYIKPKLKCNIEYLERTKDNNLRHAVFKGVILK